MKIQENQYKRLLVVGHNCFSKTGSNGRTLENYLKGWPKEKLAQLYIHEEQPDFDMCERYFCISDVAVGKSIIKRKPAGHIVSKMPEEEKELSKNEKLKKGKKKNSLIFIVRELAWRSQFWNRKNLITWLDSFYPEIILVQAGDAGFLFKIAEYIKKRYKAAIIVYNTEGYYFKKKSYLSENVFSNLLYPALNRSFRKAYDSLVNNSKTEIYNCDLLRNDYEAIYHDNSHVIMNASELTSIKVQWPKKKQVVYAGNLGLLRYKSLIEFAEALHKTDHEMYVDVYGKAPNQQALIELTKCKYIRFHGFIDYHELTKILQESQYLLHIESFHPFYKNDLKYAFSTKIADSLAVGACLFVYAPDNMAVSQYLAGTKAAVLITDKKSLISQINEVIKNEEEYMTITENGRKLAERNHDIKKNRERFQRLLLEGVGFEGSAD